MTEFRTGDEYRLIWTIRRLFRAMGNHASEYLEDLGIAASERAVMEFVFDSGKLPVPEIAAKYGVTRQHIQTSVNSLMDKGLVATEDNPRHRRSPLIALTDEGKKVFSQITRRDREAAKRLYGGVSDSELRYALTTLEKMLNNLNDGDKP